MGTASLQDRESNWERRRIFSAVVPLHLARDRSRVAWNDVARKHEAGEVSALLLANGTRSSNLMANPA